MAGPSVPFAPPAASSMAPRRTFSNRLRWLSNIIGDRHARTNGRLCSQLLTPAEEFGGRRLMVGIMRPRIGRHVANRD